jgi:anti-sigma factor RsiW
VPLFKRTRPARNNTIVDQVVANHVRSLLAAHLVDFTSLDQGTVLNRGSMAKSISLRRCATYPLMVFLSSVARLDFLDGKTVAALVYERNKHPINLFITPEPTSRSTSLTVITGRGYNVFSWGNNGTKYWAVSDLNEGELGQFTELVRAVK